MKYSGTDLNIKKIFSNLLVLLYLHGKDCYDLSLQIKFKMFKVKACCS